ncbi:MAG: tRNA dimethylallyltransferase [Arenicella sp.]|jgi:tRNA dimethylallyltransferase
MAELANSRTLIVIAGPTAVGKTSLSLDIAKELNCPILSFDSRQFYKELNIGTAKPSKKELSQADHHFINSRSIHDFYTSGMFEKDAIEKLDELFSEHKNVVAVGGSGLYIDGLCYGIDDIPSDLEVRERIKTRWEKEGLEVLQSELKLKDPEYFEIADVQNPRRVMRALEVLEISGKTYTSFRTKTKKNRNFTTIWIGLEQEIESLYERINLRVDDMMSKGLLEEVKSFKELMDLKSLRTVGYQEFEDYLSGEIDLEKAIELVKRNSRRYAKRQLLWFRKNKEIKWFNASESKDVIAHIRAINSI